MIKSKINIKSLTYTTLLSAYFAYILNIKFWTFLWTGSEINGIFDVAALVGFLIVFFSIYFCFFSLIAVPYIGKIIIAVLLICSAAADYSSQNLGIVINPDMIRNFAETTAREASDFFTLPFVCYVMLLGVLPAICLFWIKVEYSPLKKEIRNRLLSCGMVLALSALILPIFYKSYISFGRNNYQIRYYINTFNYISAVVRYHKKNANKNRSFVILDNNPYVLSRTSGQPRVLVLIVGETARANNFSLYGYSKKTNPLLEKQDIIAFQKTISCGTSTAVSLPCMFSVTGKRKFDITDAKYTQNVLDIVQAAGDRVIWKDNDDGCKNVCVRAEYINAQAENKQPYCFNDYCHDDILLDNLEVTLDEIKKDTLIVLHMMGSHGPAYYKRYPETMNVFGPACNTEDLQDCSQEEIVNAYDNTILYTDYIISSVIDLLKTKNNLQSIMLYVSDHGESLGEHHIYLHWLPDKIAPKEQKEVPMILWLSDNVKNNMNIDISCLRHNAEKNSFSHDNYAHTILGLLEVQTKTYQKNLDILNTCIKTE